MTTPKAVSTRRDFLKASAALGSALAAPAIISGCATAKPQAEPVVMTEPNHKQLKVGLVGCGGRGSGAAGQALSADPNVILTAIGDAFPEPIESHLNELKKAHPDRVKVTPDHKFVGLDAYQKVIDSGVDVVLLASPPGFRPVHLAAAVKAGIHTFCEKPVATDAPGVRSVIESVKIAREKKLTLVSGLCWRYDGARREFYKRIHEGAIGDIRAIYATYLTGPVKSMPAASQRPPDMGDLEWQMRNWYNFVWLSGDGLIEQAVHSADKIAWAFKDKPPLRCTATGGRQTKNNEGNIYDHISVAYEYENGVRAFLGQRQISNCKDDNSDYLIGTAGYGTIKGWSAPVIHGKKVWRHEGKVVNMYQQEHNEMFAAIRAGHVINNGDYMAKSTLMGIMGRMAAYTGEEITWEDALNSKETLVPKNLDWKMKLPIAPMAIPGFTKFV